MSVITPNSQLITPFLICDPVANGGTSDNLGAFTTTTVGGVTLSVTAALEIQSTEGGLLLPRLDEDEQDALVAVPGMMVYNSTDFTLEVMLTQDVWTSIGSATGDVTGPGVSVDGDIAIFSGITGKIISDSGIHVSTVTSVDTRHGAPTDDVLEISDLGILAFNADVGAIYNGTKKSLYTWVNSPENTVSIVIGGDSDFTPTTPSASLELTGTTGTLLLPRLSTVQIGSLSAEDGMFVYNTEIDRMLMHQSGAWVQVGSGAGDGTVTSVATGTGLTGGPITLTGTISLSVPVTAANGGTGVINSNTITLGGDIVTANSFTTSGNFAVTQIYTGITSVTFPTSGTLATTSQLPAGAPLTKTDDTNVTLTLGGTPATALLQATSITAGWTGILAVSRGGTNSGAALNNNRIMVSSADAIIEASALTNGQLLIGSTGSAPVAAAITGTSNQINIANGAGSITLSIVSNPVIPGTAAIILPTGTVAQRVNTVASLRYNSDASVFEGYNGSWSTFNQTNATVSSVAATGSTGLSIGGSPITTSGTLTFTLGTELQGLSQMSATGLATRTGAGTYSNRTLSTASSGRITISNGDGVSGNPTFDLATTVTGASVTNASLTFDNYGRIVSASSGTPAALTQVSDTNVTLTLGGTPTTALLQATSITAGWSGTLALTRGGLAAALTASVGGIFYSTASAGAIMPGTATAGQLLLSGALAVPTWSTSTYPGTNAINTLLYASTANVMAALPTGNNGVLVTSAGGVPSISSTLPAGIALTGDATTALQPVTYQQLQAVTNGLFFQQAVDVATTAALVGVYLNGASGVGATFTYTALGVDIIDGVTLTLNMRVLLKDQSSAFQNGIYTVTTAGALGVAGILTRATDYNVVAEIQPGDVVSVINGTINASTAWLQTATVATMGVDSIVFSQYDTIIAGTGLTKTGSTISLVAPVTIALGGTNSIASLNNNRIMISVGGAIVESGALTDGQILIGKTGSSLGAAFITGTANQVIVTNGGSSIALSTPQNIGTGSSPTFAAVSATTFTGALSGNATTATTSTNATNIGITDDTTTNGTMYPLWVTANTGNLPAKVTSTKLSFNPNTGALSTTTITARYPTTDQTTTSVTMAVNNAYSANNAGLVTLTLPAAAVVGDVVSVNGLGAGGWRIAQNASQLINLGSAATTTGTGGRLDSTNQYDTVTIRCVVANTTWVAMSVIGNITVT